MTGDPTGPDLWHHGDANVGPGIDLDLAVNVRLPGRRPGCAGCTRRWTAWPPTPGRTRRWPRWRPGTAGR